MDLLKDGIRAVGCWESFPNRVRVGGGEADKAAHFEWECSEAFIKGLAERGFNLYITQFSKGFGIEVERPYMERTKQVVALCHRYDIAVGGYTRYTTVIPETMEAEEPNCIERFCGRTGAGTYARYASQYWRYIPCPTSQEWLEYFERVIAIGVEEIGLDMICIDGPTLWPEPEACHCERCRGAFRAYLAEKYSDRAMRLERFGFEDLDHVEPPYYPSAEAVRRMRTIKDPVAQEWVFFRCARMNEIWRFLVDAVKRRRPEVWVEGNIKYAPGGNTAVTTANDLYAFHRSAAEVFFTEEPHSAELTPDGALLSYIPTFKKARRFGKTVLCYNRAGRASGYQMLTDPEELTRSYAHQLAFGRDTLGTAIRKKDPRGLLCEAPSGPTGKRPLGSFFPVFVGDYFRWHREKRDLYTSGEIIADVGIYYSTPTLALSFTTPHLGQLLVQQTLIHNRTPFSYCFSEEKERVADYRALILPDVECLSGEEADLFAEYVKAGGGLVVTGQTGALDPWRRKRSENVLAAALGVDWRGGGPETDRIGPGRVAYIPALHPAGKAVDADGAHGGGEWIEETARLSLLSDACLRVPRNAAELMAATRWAARGFSFDVLGPNGVAAEFIAQPERSRTLVHLVNFDLEHDPMGVEVEWRQEDYGADVTAMTPDPCGADVKIFTGDDTVVARLTQLHRYAVVAVHR